MLVYLIAGEPSGDMIGARLMRALKERDNNIQFAGVCGDNMEKEGMKSLFDISDLAIMGLVEVIPSIPKVLRHIKNTVNDIEAKKPDIVITIDSWSFSARVHKAIRKRSIKVKQMHYVAPQVWAWKKGRAKTMYKYIDHLLTLFPNEPKYFTPYNLPTECVGHPAVESSMVNADPKSFLEKYNLPQNGKNIALILPGSRHNEVANLLPTFLEVADRIKKEHPELQLVLPTVKTVEKRVREIVEQHGSDILIINTQEERYSAVQSACVAIAASGTVALELALVGVPHLIAYKAPKLTAWLIRRIANIKYVNLTNIILDKLIVPELLQEDCNTENIYNHTKELLNKGDTYKREVEEFEKLRQALGMGKLKPSQKASDIILNLIKE